MAQTPLRNFGLGSFHCFVSAQLVIIKHCIFQIFDLIKIVVVVQLFLRIPGLGMFFLFF